MKGSRFNGRWSAILLIVIVLSLALAGCDGDTDSNIRSQPTVSTYGVALVPTAAPQPQQPVTATPTATGEVNLIPVPVDYTPLPTTPARSYSRAELMAVGSCPTAFKAFGQTGIVRKVEFNYNCHTTRSLDNRWQVVTLIVDYPGISADDLVKLQNDFQDNVIFSTFACLPDTGQGSPLDVHIMPFDSGVKQSSYQLQLVGALNCDQADLKVRVDDKNGKTVYSFSPYPDLDTGK